MPMWVRKKLIYDVVPGVFDNIMAKWTKYSYAEDTDSRIDQDTDTDSEGIILQPPRGKYPIRIQERLEAETDEEVSPWETPYDKIYGKSIYDKLYNKTVGPYERDYQRYKKLNEILDRMSTIHPSHFQWYQQAAPTGMTGWVNNRYSDLRREFWRLKLWAEVKYLSAQEKILHARLAWDSYKKSEPTIRYAMSALRWAGLVEAQSPVQLVLFPKTNFENALSQLVLKSFQQTPREELERLKSEVVRASPLLSRPIIDAGLEAAFQISKRKTKAELDEMKREEGAIRHDLFRQSQILRKRVSALQKELEKRQALKEQQKK